mgnify:FL=1
MKKIYIINQYYYPFHAATGQLLQELAEYLVEKQFNVEIITGTNGNNELKQKEIINKVLVHRIKNTKDSPNVWVKFFSYLTFYWNLFWFLLFKAEKSSVILTLSTPPLISFVPIVLKKFKNYVIIYNIQDLYPDILEKENQKSRMNLIYLILKNISQKIINHADKIVVIGKCMKKKLKENYDIDENKITIIENWALKEIEDSKISDNIGERRFIKVLYSGNMGRGHEHETIFKCIETIKNNGLENIKFEFVGGGYNYNLLKDKVRDYKFVEFKAFVEREDLPKILSDADICLVIGSRELEGIILPSKFYGIIAARKPVIYINSGEDTITQHIKKGKLGFIINNGDYEKLYEILNFLACNRDYLKELNVNIENYYSKNLKRDLSLEKYYNLFKELEADK